MAQTFVTGGSGFIGQVLVRRLLNEGHSVRVLVRSDASAAKVSALGAEPVPGELTDPATWQGEVTGSDVVFHLAAETDITADRERHELVTVRGTQAAVDAARHAKVARFVDCGSEAALLAGDPLVDADETAPLRPDSEAAYCAVKAAETAARAVPVPARWFLGQPCTLRTDKAVAELGYAPIVSHAAGLDAVRDSVAANGA